jgi:transcriptional regulator with XRE-family HTH domain
MPKAPEESIPSLIIRARAALGLSQSAFGAKLGWSTRSQGRIESKGSIPVPRNLIKIGRLVTPVDATLGNQLIRRAKDIAVKVGLVLPELPAAPLSTALSVAPNRSERGLRVAGAERSLEAKPIGMRHLVDAVVCAATDHGELLPRDVRPILLAAFTRAEELGLDFAEVRRALEPRRATPRGRKQEE